MSLREWQKNSWLVEHKSSPEEIAALFAIVERDLASAKVAGLADDWRLSIGYNAALQAATAALAASGFRAAREQHHYRTIQSLALTIGWPAAKVERFDRLHGSLVPNPVPNQGISGDYRGLAIEAVTLCP